MLFVSIPMGVCAYQAADWSVDVRHSTMFGYVPKITLGYPREIIPFIDNYATCYIDNKPTTTPSGEVIKINTHTA